MSDDWPNRIIDLPLGAKGELIKRDVHRYFEQVRAERLAEARADVAERDRQHRVSLPWWRRWLG